MLHLTLLFLHSFFNLTFPHFYVCYGIIIAFVQTFGTYLFLSYTFFISWCISCFGHLSYNLFYISLQWYWFFFLSFPSIIYLLWTFYKIESYIFSQLLFHLQSNSNFVLEPDLFCPPYLIFIIYG